MTTKVTTRTASTVIANREPFVTSGALFAENNNSLSFGCLPNQYRDALCADRDQAHANNQKLYVVYSYATPIAWYNPITDKWTKPDVKYSVTTTKHQSNVRVTRTTL